jgi:hypothetical protein
MNPENINKLIAEHLPPCPIARDFYGDLNAMHEAEKILDIGQQFDYMGRLQKFDPYLPFVAVSSTASQRAEAFLKTIGKWEDE